MIARPVSWSPFAAKALQPALGPDMDAIKQEVKTGMASLWFFENRGYVITRLEKDRVGLILVVVAGAGRDLPGVMKYWQVSAAINGIDRVRVHTFKPGVGRMLQRCGFLLSEIRGPEQVFLWVANHQAVAKLKISTKKTR